MHLYKSTAKPSNPAGRVRPQSSQALRPPSPKVEATPSARRPTAGSPGPKIPSSSRSNSRKSPSNFADTLLNERMRGKWTTEDGELSDKILLSLSQHERDSLTNEQQSIFEKSVIEDAVLHEMVEKQKAIQTMRTSSRYSTQEATTPPSSSPSFLAKETTTAPAPLFEREVTESTAMSALTDELTCESDDGTFSDRTHPAVYCATRTHDSTAELVMKLSDDQLHKLLELMQLEQGRRASSAHSTPTGEKLAMSFSYPESNLMAIENRKNLRRSRSGGSESAFYHSRKLLSVPGSASKKEPALSTMSVELEDAELSSAFGSLTPVSSSRAVSRGSGAHQMLDKMNRTAVLPCVSPPLTPTQSGTNSACNSHPATPLLHSPHDFPHSQSSSRPASRLSGMIHLQSILPHEAPAVPVIARRANKRAAAPTAKVEEIITSLDEIQLEAAGPAAALGQSRELMLSPFSAFDDFSVGSQSMNSSRSSKARRRMDIDTSPPMVTSKQVEGRKVPTLHTTFHTRRPTTVQGTKKVTKK